MTHTRDGGSKTGAIPGHEFSGVVEAVGADIDSSKAYCGTIKDRNGRGKVVLSMSAGA